MAKDLPKTKTCTRCLQRKKLASFGRNPRMKLGRKSYCKDCSAELQREWNAAKRVSKKRGGGRAPAKKARPRSKKTDPLS